MSTPKVYVEFAITGVLRVDEHQKKELLERLQLAIADFTADYEVELLKIDNAIDLYTESEVIGSAMKQHLDEDDYN